MLLICLPKSQNYLFSLLKNNPQKTSETLKNLKGIKLNGSGERGEQIINTEAGLKGKNGPASDLTEIQFILLSQSPISLHSACRG